MRAMWAFVVTALVLGGCAQTDWIDRTLVTVDVTGVWEGRLIATTSASRDVVLVLQQQGGKVTGEIRNLSTGSVTSAGSAPIEGTVNGDTLSLHDVSSRLIRLSAPSEW
jgi:hypothetical protein